MDKLRQAEDELFSAAADYDAACTTEQLRCAARRHGGALRRVVRLEKKKRIVVIGYRAVEDATTLSIICSWMAEHRGRKDLRSRFIADDFDLYDMGTCPAKGDALDHLGSDVEMVIALHLYGIDLIPGPSNMRGGYLYNRNNGDLLRRCMELKIPLAAWGIQPWHGIQKKTKIHDNALWLYEPVGEAICNHR